MDGRSEPTLTRRRFASWCALGVAAGATLGATRRASGQAGPPATSAGPADPRLVEHLVAANRILVDQGVLDAYGHVSVRHDRDMTAGDVLQYDRDSNAVDAAGRTLYLGRFIHGEIYKARPDVQAVVHSHSPSVIAFGVSTVPLRPLYHMRRRRSARRWPGPSARVPWP